MADHLAEHHRLISEQKRAALLHAADAMIDQGVAFHWTTSARRARVSVSVKLINDPKHRDLKEHVKQKLAAAYEQRAAEAIAANNQTAAQLRVKVANQAAQLHRQDHVIRMLERKLGEHLGREIAPELPAITAAALQSQPAIERIAELEGRIVELEDQLLAQFLVAFGTACGRGAHYQVEADRHYPNEICILVGPSAKSNCQELWMRR